MNSHSKTYDGKSTKFAIMVGSIEHFKAAILTADQLQKNNRNFTIEVVAVGELVKDIAEDQTLLEDINKAEALGVKLTVCEVGIYCCCITACGGSSEKLMCSKRHCLYVTDCL